MYSVIILSNHAKLKMWEYIFYGGDAGVDGDGGGAHPVAPVWWGAIIIMELVAAPANVWHFAAGTENRVLVRDRPAHILVVGTELNGISAADLLDHAAEQRSPVVAGFLRVDDAAVFQLLGHTCNTTHRSGTLVLPVWWCSGVSSAISSSDTTSPGTFSLIVSSSPRTSCRSTRRQCRC